ncbi:MAG: hypothetical protein ACE15D_05615 [Candidatus Eisenbacteria bacterium]
MTLWLWILATALLLGIGVIAASRGSFRVGSWLLLAFAGLGFSGTFLSIALRAEDPFWTERWMRLQWITTIFSLPPLLLFSYRFGRPVGSPRPATQRIVVFLSVLAVLVIAAFGLRQAPVELQRPEGVGEILVLRAPVGRPLGLVVLAALAIALVNLQATLEAARASSRRRTERSIYALAPVIIVAIYLVADLVLYGQQRIGKTGLLLPATMVSSIGFAVAMGVRRVGDVSLPVGRPVVYSSVVLTALGFLLVGLALLSQVFRYFGVPWEARWYEKVTVSILLLVFLLSAFPGLRGDVRRFLDRNLFVSRFDYRHLWEQANRAFAGVDALDRLTPALRDLLRNTIGPVRLQIWIAGGEGKQLLPLSEPALPVLDETHPLRAAMEQTERPLLLEEAHRLEEIPLQIACETMAKSHGLTIYLPVRGGGTLIGILGLGSTAGRILHPEDIAVAQTLADQLGGFLGARTFPSQARESAKQSETAPLQERSDAGTPGTIRPSA